MAWFHSFSPGIEKLYVVIIAAICWAIGNIRNKVTFEKHILRSPSEITYFVVSLLVYWGDCRNRRTRSA
jgi:hypothetical protein